MSCVCGPAPLGHTSGAGVKGLGSAKDAPALTFCLHFVGLTHMLEVERLATWPCMRWVDVLSCSILLLFAPLMSSCLSFALALVLHIWFLRYLHPVAHCQLCGILFAFCDVKSLLLSDCWTGAVALAFATVCALNFSSGCPQPAPLSAVGFWSFLALLCGHCYLPVDWWAGTGGRGRVYIDIYWTFGNQVNDKAKQRSNVQEDGVVLWWVVGMKSQSNSINKA